MPPILLVLEGPDGVGKSAHAKRLVASLRDRGVDALLFQHIGPWRGAGLVEAALHFANERARMLRIESERGTRVVVCDRWVMSTLAAAKAATTSRAREAMRLIAEAERVTLPGVDRLALLTAPDDVLDARLCARGAVPTEREIRERAGYRQFIEAVTCEPQVDVIDTSRSFEEVSTEILDRALRAIPSLGAEAA